MVVTREIDLKDFDFWGEAEARRNLLTDDELDEIQGNLEIENPYGIDETELNDMFAYEFEIVCDSIGLTEDEVNER